MPRPAPPPIRFPVTESAAVAERQMIGGNEFEHYVGEVIELDKPHLWPGVAEIKRQDGTTLKRVTESPNLLPPLGKIEPRQSGQRIGPLRKPAVTWLGLLSSPLVWVPPAVCVVLIGLFRWWR